MKLIILSGRSGSGKSSALQMLEDLGFNCIDNLPASLLPALVEQLLQENNHSVAVCIDARNAPKGLSEIEHLLKELDAGIDQKVIYLEAEANILTTRFSATRRKHPLSHQGLSLSEAIEAEKTLLKNIAGLANQIIDTSRLSLHELRSRIKESVSETEHDGLSLQFVSFGFKYGAPNDTDLMYDVRCLPNPYWDPEIRNYNGTEKQVIDFLKDEPLVIQMLADINQFLKNWLPQYEANNRAYLTVAIGCTGGQHRSVYIAEQLVKYWNNRYNKVHLVHRELKNS